MRHIPNTKFVDFEVEGIDNYADMIKQLVSKATSGGFDPASMRLALDIMNVADKASHTIILEDAQWEYLNSRVKTFPFSVAHEELIDFINTIGNAEAVAVAVVDEAKG